MKEKRISDWKTVFSFVFKQMVHEKAFIITTFIISFLMFMALFLVTSLSGPDKEEVKDLAIQKVYVLDETGLTPVDFHALAGDNALLSKVTFVNENRSQQEILQSLQDSEETKGILLDISREEAGFTLKAILPEGAALSRGDGDDLLKQLVPLFETNKLIQVGLTDVQWITITKPVAVTYTNAGEEAEGMGGFMIKNLAPLFFGFILYMMLLIYGQTMVKAMVTEKTSKLLEYLLTSARPKSIIAGKVLAMYVIAILQLILWTLAGVVGYMVGNSLVKSQNPGYVSEFEMVVKVIRENTGSAFTVGSIALAVVAVLIGFLFYCVYAGLVGSTMSKAEDISSGVGIFQIPVIISFLITSFGPLMENEWMIQISRYIPFTAPFTIPAGIIVGNVGIVGTCISLGILLISTLFLIALSGKVYKGMIFYTGNKLSIKKVLLMITNK